MGFSLRLELRFQEPPTPETILKLRFPSGEIEYGLVTGYKPAENIAVIMVYDGEARKKLIENEAYVTFRRLGD